MKPFILLLCCLLLAGCTKPAEETMINTTIFDKAAGSAIEKIIISDEKEARIIRNPKQISLLIQNLKKLEAIDAKPITSESFIEIMYEDRSSEVFAYDDEKVCASACAAWDRTTVMKLCEGFDTKHIVYAEIPEFLSEIFAEKLDKAVIFEPCEEETCQAKQLDNQALYDFKAYLRMLDFGDKAERPKEITAYLQLTAASATYLLEISLSEDGSYIGMNDEWISFKYQDAILDTQLAGYNSSSVKVKNPTYRQSTFFDEGIGAELEISGFIYDEEKHEFNLDADKKITISESTIQIEDKEIRSYNMISDSSQFNIGQEDVCTYYLNAQESEGCTLDEAKAAYIELQNEIDRLFNKMNLSLMDIRAFMLDQKEARFVKQLDEAYPKLEAEKPMLGNVTNLDQYFKQLGYAENEDVYSIDYSDPNFGDVIISYDSKNMLFKAEKGNSYAQLRLGSVYGEGIDEEDPDKTVCTLDYITEMAVGECSSQRYYAQSGRHLNARHIMLGWQYQLSLSDEELLQYAQMINENR